MHKYVLLLAGISLSVALSGKVNATAYDVVFVYTEKCDRVESPVLYPDGRLRYPSISLTCQIADYLIYDTDWQ